MNSKARGARLVFAAMLEEYGVFTLGTNLGYQWLRLQSQVRNYLRAAIGPVLNT